MPSLQNNLTDGMHFVSRAEAAGEAFVALAPTRRSAPDSSAVAASETLAACYLASAQAASVQKDWAAAEDKLGK